MEEQEHINLKAQKQSKLRYIVFVILLTISIIVAILLAYRTVQYRREAVTLHNEIATLKDQINTDSSAVDTDNLPADIADGPDNKCTGGSSYAAAIGKYKITLDDPHVIIRDLDAGFEGGPVTSLEVGRCLSGEQNVVDTPPAAEVKILAHPASTASDLRASYESRNGTLTADGTVAIAGVTAQKYKLDALFSTRVIYLDNAGIGYEIELSDTNTATSTTLTDLISDWIFLP